MRDVDQVVSIKVIVVTHVIHQVSRFAYYLVCTYKKIPLILGSCGGERCWDRRGQGGSRGEGYVPRV